MTPLSPADRAAVVEILARMVVADLRKYPTLPPDQEVTDSTVVPRRGSEARPGFGGEE